MTIRFGPSSRVIGVDDGPFVHEKRVRVVLVGVLMRATHVEGISTTRVIRDGFGATESIRRMLATGNLRNQAQAVLIDGIAVGGFNVVDLPRLSSKLGVPVLSVMRKAPDLEKFFGAIRHTSSWERRWRAIERAGPVCRAGALHFQVAGAAPEDAERILEAACPSGSSYPEALRVAHLVAGGITRGTSRGRA